MKLRGKLLQVLAWALSFSGCASIGPPVPPVLELPRPPADLRAVRRGSHVTLTWTIPTRTTERQRVRYLGQTRVCRSVDAALKECGTPLGNVPPPDFAGTNPASGQKLMATYTDVLPLDLSLRSFSDSASYAVEVLNRDGRAAGLSNQVLVPLVETLAPPTDFAARVTAQGVVLTWTGVLLASPFPDPLRQSYRVYRRAEGSSQSIPVGERGAGAERDLSLPDQSIEWEKTYYYHADTLAVLVRPGKPEASIDGDSTPEVKVFTHDVFPPAVPSGLQAVFSGPGQAAFIDLVWSPVTDADLAGYNVYRHEAGGAPTRLNSALVPTPAFRDAEVVTGKRYVYSVSAVDQRGNESARSEEAEESVP